MDVSIRLDAIIISVRGGIRYRIVLNISGNNDIDKAFISSIVKRVNAFTVDVFQFLWELVWKSLYNNIRRMKN